MTSDVQLFLVQSGNPLAVQSLVTPTDQGNTVSGEAKLAQRVLLEFGTEQGSMPYLPSRGSTLMSQLASGAIRTEYDLFVEFAAASLSVLRNLQAEETDQDPDNERIGTLYLAGALLDGRGGVTLNIAVVSRAETVVGIELPVQLSI